MSGSFVDELLDCFINQPALLDFFLIVWSLIVVASQLPKLLSVSVWPLAHESFDNRLTVVGNAIPPVLGLMMPVDG